MGQSEVQVGDVLRVNFPFADKPKLKGRPAVVLARVAYADVVLCQMTTQEQHGQFAVKITMRDFHEGGLGRVSYVRVGEIYTVNTSLVTNKLGTLNTAAMQEVGRALSGLFRGVLQ